MVLGGHKRNRNGLYTFKQSKTEDVNNETILTKEMSNAANELERHIGEEGDDDDEDQGSDSESDEEFDDLTIATGVDTNCASDMVDMMRLAEENDLNFVCVPLFHPRMRIDPSIPALSERGGLITRSDMALHNQDWSENVIGKVSEWIDLDNPDPNIRRTSESCVRKEHLYASHLGIQSIIIPAPKHTNSPNYCRTITNLNHSNVDIWLRIPISNQSNLESKKSDDDHFSWTVWDNFRHISNSDKRVSVALEINHINDEFFITPQYVNKWVAEPLKALIIWTRIFSRSKKGKLSLSLRFRNMILILCNKFQLHVILKGRPDGAQGYTIKDYFNYVQRLLDKESEKKSSLNLYERFCKPFRDSLRSPLQPLMENLDSKTYSVMEEDPVKYDTYEEAIGSALSDKNEENKFRLINKHGKRALERDVEPVVVMVVGPGRGPLVKATLRASEHTHVPVRVYAIEKNLHAVITLRNRAVAEEWGSDVKIINKDMRHWIPPERADIMVSELLGSWADNELSPECLDVAQGTCLKDNGVSIPTDYTSYMAPMTSTKLWTAARDMTSLMRGESGARTGLDSPYVVHFHNCRVLTKAQPLFKFSHPNELPVDLIDNSRYAALTFISTEDTTIHGFAGTFECTLYKDITFSTVPHTFSEGMFSWFPLFIPLSTPLRIKKGENITVAIW
eukprot:CAMPEP_0119051778 /NCGR_PEP_ID=MMETSP1177-20130426/73282_1 /TAXON_ID=2985 /ORGANISM="Ochromonas sp, Strain CCMP1899" /LENGTH=677 /DNA_ID=CAMNT_0007031099 /DNA_START=71 /DNA_END=2101 /DNA_ORIENTATION=+